VFRNTKEKKEKEKKRRKKAPSCRRPAQQVHARFKGEEKKKKTRKKGELSRQLPIALNHNKRGGGRGREGRERHWRVFAWPPKGRKGGTVRIFRPEARGKKGKKKGGKGKIAGLQLLFGPKEKEKNYIHREKRKKKKRKERRKTGTRTEQPAARKGGKRGKEGKTDEAAETNHLREKGDFGSVNASHEVLDGKGSVRTRLERRKKEKGFLSFHVFPEMKRGKLNWCIMLLIAWFGGREKKRKGGVDLGRRSLNL